jgi:ketosteroid isomerase-like protein
VIDTDARTTSMALEQDLLEMERALWSGGPEAYQAQTDDQCLVVFATMAGVMPKGDIAKSAEKGRWTEVILTPKGFVQPSPDVAVLAYDCTAKKKDGAPYHALISSGYVKRADGWKLTFHQQTEVPIS